MFNANGDAVPEPASAGKRSGGSSYQFNSVGSQFKKQLAGGSDNLSVIA